MASPSGLSGPPTELRRQSSHASTVTGWNLVAAASAAAVLVGSAGPIADPDVFWHVQAGKYALKGERFPFPDPWSDSLPGVHWHSTAWLSEVVLAWIQDLGGWGAVVTLRLTLVLGLLVLLGRHLLRSLNGWQGPLVFAVVALSLTFYIQDRPQTVSLLYLVWLSGELTVFLRRGRTPSPTRFLLITWSWAWLHAYATLAPLLLVAVALARLADGRKLPETRRVLLTAAGALVLCAATPVGPRQLLAPLEVSRAARSYISEWHDTSVSIPAAWGFFIVLALLVAAWARAQEPVPRSELLFTGALVLYGLTAIRNAAPASVLLAPLLLERLRSTYPPSAGVQLDRRLVALFSALAVAAGAASYANSAPLLTGAPTRVVAALRAQPTPLRVLDAYNISGYLIWATDGHVRLVVDGRAERYGASFLHRYAQSIRGGGDWRAFVRTAQPQVAVLEKDGPLPDLLVSSLGWRREFVDQRYVLLSAPGVTLVATR